MAGTAPAIVHNPMKIYVPKRDLLLDQGWSWPLPLKKISVIDEYSFFCEPGLTGLGNVDNSFNDHVQQVEEAIVERLRVAYSQLHRDSGYRAATEAEFFKGAATWT